MASIGDLQVDLRLASAKFEQGLKDVNAKLGNFSKEIADVKGAATGLAGALAIGAFGVWIKQSIDAADAAAKAAQGLGVTTEALSGLQFAAELSGVSNEKLSDSLKDLNKNIYEASIGTKTQADAFDALGVSVRDSEGNIRSADSVLLDIADRFAASADGADKTAIAMKVFGESGRTLVPLLNQGSEGIKQMTDRAKSLGLVIDGDAAKSAERFNDNLTIFQATTRGTANAIATAMLPTLGNLTDELVRVAESENFANEAASFLSSALKILVSAGVVVKSTFQLVGEIIGGTAAAIAAAAEGDFSRALAILKDESAGDNLKANLESISRIWDETASSATESSKAQLAAYLRLGSSASELSDEQRKAAEKAAAAIQKTLDTLEQEADTVGFSKDKITLYKLALEGATEAQLNHAKTSLFIVDSYKQSVAALDELIAAEDAYNAKKAQVQGAIDSVSSGLSTKNESIQAQYEARLAAIAQARQYELDTAISYDELEIRAALSKEEQLTAIEQAEAQKRKAIQDAVHQSRLQAATGFFGNLSALMNTKSKKLFEIGKAAAIAETAINTSKAAMGAYSALAGIPIVGPALGVAAAAAAIAAGGAQIQQIKSQQFGGGGSVSFAGGGATSTYNPPQPTVPYGSQSANDEKSGKVINLNFNGNVNGFDIAGLAEQLGDYINQSDTIFIDGNSRTGLQFATAF